MRYMVDLQPGNTERLYSHGRIWAEQPGAQERARRAPALQDTPQAPRQFSSSRSNSEGDAGGADVHCTCSSLPGWHSIEGEVALETVQTPCRAR